MHDESTYPRPPEEPRSAEGAFLDYFARRDEGELVDIEDYCARFPHWAEELRVLARDWREIAAGLERAAGPEIESSVTPDELAAEARARQLVDEKLARLAQRDGRQRYRVVDEIDRGGMGAVMRVFDEDMKRELAMKVVIQETGAGAHATPARRVARFLEEAQIAGRLDHPGIVPVHDLGVDEQGAAFFTMKLVRGATLRDAIRRAHDPDDDEWSLTRVVGVLQKVCEAMAYAHERGVLHRDLKPTNIMVGAYGEAFVMDWGLARVVDPPGTTRAPDGPTAAKPSALGSSGRAPGSSSVLATSVGDVVGTPAYMSPEQARGQIDRLGPASDVYSAGAVLYHAIAGRAPYAEAGVSGPNHAVLKWVHGGPPEPLVATAHGAPPELIAICSRAMAREIDERYPSMRAMADDLRAFLEGRVVSAFESGAWADVRKWILRNRTLAAALLAATILALGGALAVALVESRGRRVAEAERSIAQRERANVLRLSSMRRVAELVDAAFVPEMWPPRPGLERPYEDWLSRARELLRGLDDDLEGVKGHRSQLAELRSRALEPDPTRLAAARRDHSLAPSLALARRRLAAWERARSVRAGERQLARPEVPPHMLDLPAGHLERFVWPRVDPNRVDFGEEQLALVVAEHALGVVQSDEELADALDNLAYARLANGLDQAALEASRRALDVAPRELRGKFQQFHDVLSAEVEAWSGERGEVRLAQLRTEIERLQTAIEAYRPWVFEDEASAWWHEQLAALVDELERLAHPEVGAIAGVVPGRGWGVERRLLFARELRARSVEGPAAAQAWERAVASIADPRECPAYGGLEIEPQLGLLPIGRDPLTGLWEFAHLQTGEPASEVLGPDGASGLRIEPETGIVLVLLPGGRFDMGAQSEDPSAPCYDPWAGPTQGPVHTVELDPFFVAKFEVSQGQWLRTMGENPASFGAGDNMADAALTLDYPVESISWPQALEFTRQLGLALPTEAQWEYAARGGTDTPWSTGAEETSLEGFANLADQKALTERVFDAVGAPWLDDGYALHAAVHVLRPNPFGLHHVHGNVGEWCEELHKGYYLPTEPGTGRRLGGDSTGRERVFRGGSFHDGARLTRSAARGSRPGSVPSPAVGLRPVRRLE